MYLDWKLDETDGVEPDTPIGRITISGEEGSISEDNLMLDTFLEALLDGLSALAKADAASIDTIDEPHPLVLQRTGDGVKLTFGRQTADIEDKGALCQDLIVVIENLLNRLDSAARASRQEPLEYRKLRGFLARGHVEP